MNSGQLSCLGGRSGRWRRSGRNAARLRRLVIKSHGAKSKKTYKQENRYTKKHSWHILQVGFLSFSLELVHLLGEVQPGWQERRYGAQRCRIFGRDRLRPPPWRLRQRRRRTYSGINAVRTAELPEFQAGVYVQAVTHPLARGFPPHYFLIR